MPSHHYMAVCNPKGSSCKVSPGEGITECQVPEGKMHIIDLLCVAKMN